VSENRELRRIYGPYRDEVTGVWIKRHNEGLHYLYSAPNIFRVIKSRIIRWTGACCKYRAEERRIQIFGVET
jgi:hypothetical protein